MSKKLSISGETPGASQEGTLAIEQFLNDNYRFRRNILNGKVEFATLLKADSSADSLSQGLSEAHLEFRPLTLEAFNSIVRKAKKEQVLEKGNPKTEITEFPRS